MRCEFALAAATILLPAGCAYTSYRIHAMAPHGDGVVIVADRTVEVPGFGQSTMQTVNACDVDDDNNLLVCRRLRVAFDAQMPKIGISYQDREEGDGAVVTLVKDDGLAAGYGVAVGDIIVMVNGKKTPNRAAVAAALAAAGKTVNLSLLRGDDMKGVKITRATAP